MRYKVSANDLSHLSLNEEDTVASVLQNVAVILSTPVGTVPMYREFGLQTDFLDLPLPLAEVRMIAPVREAIERWEPRAKYLGASIARDVVNGELTVTVEVEIEDE